MIKKELLLATLLVSSYSYCPPTEMALWIMSTPSTAHIQVQQQQTSSNISGGLISAITASFSWAKEWLAAKATTANEKQWNYENRLSSTAQAAFAADKYTVEGLLQKQLGEFTAKLESCKTPQDFTNVLSELQHNILLATQRYGQLVQMVPATQETWNSFTATCSRLCETFRENGIDLPLQERIKSLTTELTQTFANNPQAWQNLALKKDFLQAEQQLAFYGKCLDRFEKMLTQKFQASNTASLNEKTFLTKSSSTQQAVLTMHKTKLASLERDLSMLNWKIQGHQQALTALVSRSDFVKCVKGMAGIEKSLTGLTVQRIEIKAQIQTTKNTIAHIHSLLKQQETSHFKQSLTTKTITELRVFENKIQGSATQKEASQELISHQEKQQYVREALQQKTYTPEYKQQLEELKDTCIAQREYGINAIHEDRINAIKITGHEQGVVREVQHAVPPQAQEFLKKQGVPLETGCLRFVGNTFEQQIFKENVQTIEQICQYAGNQQMQGYVEATACFVDTAHEMACMGSMKEAVVATDMAHLMANLCQTIATTGKVLGHAGLGAVEGAIDSVTAPIKMLAHPVKTAEGLYQAGKFAGNLALGDPAAIQKFQAMVHGFSQLPIEQKAEQLSRFAVSLLGPAKLAHASGFAKGLTAFGNALQKEVAVLREGARMLAQVTRPERTLSVAGTKIIEKLPESVLRKAENLSRNKPKLEIIKKAEVVGEKCREIILPKMKTFEQARNKALEIVGDLGPGSKPHICPLDKSVAFDKVVGRMSSDRKLLWRLDYDPIKGIHIHAEDISLGKGINARNYVIPFEGTEETFISLLKHLNK